MSNRLREPDALAHALTIGGDFSIPGLNKIYALERNLSQLVCFLLLQAVYQQERINKFSSRYPSRERIKLCAVANLAKQLFRMICGNAQQRNLTASRTQ